VASSGLACILNSTSGCHPGPELHEKLFRIFAENGTRARILLASSGAEIPDLARRAVKEESQIIVAGGGDGTVNAVASELMGSSITLGVLPLGTLNHFAKDLHIPQDLEGAVRNLITGRAIPVDVGEVNGRFFLNNSSLGIYPRIVRHCEEQRNKKGRNRWVAFVQASLSVVRHYSLLRVRLLLRKTAGTRSWAEAEENKRHLEDQLAGRTGPSTAGVLLSEAIIAFHANKEAQGVKAKGRASYILELQRLQDFSDAQSHTFVAQALTLENLIAFRGTWSQYKSSGTRNVAQKRLTHFLRFCFNAGWIPRIPQLSTVKVTSPETLPLTEAEYSAVLAAAKELNSHTHLVVQLMRWSGLAIRDASTLKRSDLHFDNGVHKIISRRTKTGTALYIPIPADVAAAMLAIKGNPSYFFWDRQTATSSEASHADHISKLITKAFKAAGVASEGQMVSHRLRCTFAVDLLTKGVPLEHVSKLLGHTSVVTTEKSYATWVKGRQDRLDALVTDSWAKKTG
jgi:integrase